MSTRDLIFDAAVLIPVTVAGIAIVAILWWKRHKLNRQDREQRERISTRFEQSAAQAERHGWRAEANLARVLRDTWKGKR